MTLEKCTEDALEERLFVSQSRFMDDQTKLRELGMITVKQQLAKALSLGHESIGRQQVRGLHGSVSQHLQTNVGSAAPGDEHNGLWIESQFLYDLHRHHMRRAAESSDYHRLTRKLPHIGHPRARHQVPTGHAALRKDRLQRRAARGELDARRLEFHAADLLRTESR